jgi:hypothetical protein
LAEIDARISGLLKELADLQTKRVNIVMHLCVEEALNGLSPMAVIEGVSDD